MEGSNNFNGEAGSNTSTWITLCDSVQSSGLSFSGGSNEKTFVFANDLSFKHCVVTLVMKLDASKTQVGSYKIAHNYAKESSSVLLETLTGKKAPAHNILAPIRETNNKSIS